MDLPRPTRDGDLALAVGEAVELLPGAALAVADPAVGHVADQPAGDRRREHRIAGRDRLHRADDLAGRGVLEQEPARPGAQGTQDVVAHLERRQHDHFGRVVVRAQQLGGRETVHAGHPDVHQDDVGLVLGDRRRDLVAVGGLADDRDLLDPAEHHRQPRADERVVVDDQHADHPGHGNHACSRKSPSSS